MYYFACPSCNNDKTFYRVRRERGAGLGSLAILIFGGLLAAILFLRFERHPRIQCAHCGYVFSRPGMGTSPAATTAIVLLFCILLAAILGCVAECYPEVFQNVPGWRHIENNCAFVEQHALGVAVAIVVALILTTSVAVIVSLVANWRLRRRIRAEFDHEPTEYAPPPPGAEEAESSEPPVNCPQCDYNLTGNVTGICPECGAPISCTGSGE